MPMTPACQPVPGDQDERPALCRLRLRCVQGRVEHALFDGLALLVEAVELFGQPPGLCRIVRGQQSRAEIGPADPPAGIDPRPEQEAGMIGARRAGHPRNIGQRRQTGIAPPRHDP